MKNIEHTDLNLKPKRSAVTNEADNIIFEYSRPYSTIDSENLYFAACVYQAAYIELQAKLDKVTLELEFTREYLNPEDTSFRQMCDTFATFTPIQKNRLIDLASALKNVSLAENV